MIEFARVFAFFCLPTDSARAFLLSCSARRMYVMAVSIFRGMRGGDPVAFRRMSWGASTFCPPRLMTVNTFPGLASMCVRKVCRARCADIFFRISASWALSTAAPEWRMTRSSALFYWFSSTCILVGMMRRVVRSKLTIRLMLFCRFCVLLLLRARWYVVMAFKF